VTERAAFRYFSVVAVAGWLAACGSSPNAPTPPPLMITCPPNVAMQSPDGNAVTATFEAPQTSGGTAPITATCSPQNGSQFAVGTAAVACEARDSRNQAASCGFSVTVAGPPRLTAIKFLAFGDSLTYGVISPAVSLLIVSVPDSYPFVLQGRLPSRYRQQTPVVLNDGNPGETASGTGVQRFRGSLLQHRPEVVLLMEGTNDLLSGQTGANFAIDALRAMITEAKSQGVKVALATIPPQRPGGRRDAVARSIPAFNDRVRALASAEGAVLVDVFDGMKDDLSYIGIDDLHPTPRGYDAMATIFFDAIQAAYEERPPTGLRR
jgi:lysophospholipase L1-like esterase